VVLQLLRFSVLVSLVGLPFILDARTVEERLKVVDTYKRPSGASRP
jgi:hypothetical protein